MSNARKFMDSNVPSSIESEQALLGAILLDYGVLSRISFLSVNDFYLVKHKNIFSAMRTLQERGVSIDFLTVSEQMSSMGFPKDESYIISLLNSVVTVSGAEDYARIIKESSLSRNLINVSTEIAEIAYSDIPFPDKRAKSLSLIGDIQSSSKNSLSLIREDTEQVKVDIFKKAMNPGTVFGVATGFSGLDNVLGGLHPSLRLIGARPSMGKTAYALSMAYNMSVIGKKRVAYVSYEMTTKQLIQRLISYHSGISIMAMMQGGNMYGGQITPFSDDELNIIRNSADFVMELPIFLNRTFLSMNELGDSLIEKRYEDENIDAIFVDYLQLTDEDGENRNLKIGGASRKLKIIADRDEIPVTALCQLVRKVDEKEGNRAANSDLRDSGELEANADLIEFPYREDYWNLIKNPMTKKNHKFESMLTKDRLTGRAPFLFDGMFINPTTGMIQETPIE